ncbi:protein glxC [Bradyrhizobium sp. BRP56]|uniref:GltB/FmdC/FwdC-like GXGXG domain-containing protein n=1 Tax=Bradyrhizobium sp. BRP56 TaxID=2793819 RepID=UPI001CD3CC7D|nr:protein glxC [Bradyrhizobium sp. BRP56]MCA1397898.1 protein glxC [Bradyrhizobium sp. BRP56]
MNQIDFDQPPQRDLTQLRSSDYSREIDLLTTPLRDLNATLQAFGSSTKAEEASSFRVLSPNGAHAIAVGIDAPVDVEISGHVGYYCGGMNKRASIVVEGNAGQGVGENMMSGLIHVKGDASQCAGASAHGGLLLIEGNASARCGISIKGADIVVKGGIGHLSGFMGQSGRLVAFGDAGEALGDSIYEARIYVRGKVESLGADCIEKELRDGHRAELFALLKQADEAHKVDVSDFRRYGSARKLYNFHIDNAGAY